MIIKEFKTSADDRFNWLCERIQEENDYSKFSALVRELNETIERKDLQSEHGRPRTEKVA